MMMELNVIYACDDNYAPYACISICSLLENNKSFDAINIYVVLDNVSQENSRKLKEQIEVYKRKFIPIDATELNRKLCSLNVPKYRGSYATNYRFLFEEYLEKNVSKFLYLDCDTIIAGSLKALVSIDMETSCALVAQDALTNKYKKMLGFKNNESYFNAGVLFVDVENWKKFNCTEKLMDHIKNERAEYCNPDQDLLNILLKNHVKYVGPEYNLQPIHKVLKSNSYKKIYENEAYYSIEEIEFAKTNPKIIHVYRFLGQFPWHVNNQHPDTELFDYYMMISEQKNYVKKWAKLSTIMKIERTLYRFLPKSMFYRIFSIAQSVSFKSQDRKLRKIK